VRKFGCLFVVLVLGWALLLVLLLGTCDSPERKARSIVEYESLTACMAGKGWKAEVLDNGELQFSKPGATDLDADLRPCMRAAIKVEPETS
jgi:hypothetical protein